MQLIVEKKLNFTFDMKNLNLLRKEKRITKTKSKNSMDAMRGDIDVWDSVSFPLTD